jgi:hypothetical protein
MHAFGLSTSEVVRIQPHEDDFGEVLQVNRPANLPRFVPVTTHQQRELLDAARRVTPPGGVLSALPERCPEQSRRRLVYMTRRAAGLEVDQGCGPAAPAAAARTAAGSSSPSPMRHPAAPSRHALAYQGSSRMNARKMRTSLWPPWLHKDQAAARRGGARNRSGDLNARKPTNTNVFNALEAVRACEARGRPHRSADTRPALAAAATIGASLVSKKNRKLRDPLRKSEQPKVTTPDHAELPLARQILHAFERLCRPSIRHIDR